MIKEMSYWTSPSFFIKNITPEYKKERENAIIKKVCDSYEITIDELKGTSRNRNFVVPRQIISYIFRDYFNYTLKQIGYILKKNHATIIYNVKTVKDLIVFDNSFKVEVNKMLNFAKYYQLEVKKEKIIKGKTSQYKGVSYHKITGKWRATLYLGNGKYKHLGIFKNEIKAFQEYIKEKNNIKQLNTVKL
jgi:hypothetical protein|tara:strand:+ start:41 stop:610 length:570 start_codon:yes stop_codon:yes gene_type:complete